LPKAPEQETPHHITPLIEPLKLQLEAFLDAVETRKSAKCSGCAARLSLKAALAILDKIREHSELVSRTLVADGNRSPTSG